MYGDRENKSKKSFNTCTYRLKFICSSSQSKSNNSSCKTSIIAKPTLIIISLNPINIRSNTQDDKSPMIKKNM